jgi:hypothetical protein
MAASQMLDGENRRAREERWVWDGQAVGELLESAFGAEAPLLAVDPAGCLPYFSGLPALDMLGLNDRMLAWHAPGDLGGGWIGHEAGDGDYVLERRPDLVVFCSPAGGGRPCFRSGKELVREPGFRALYHLVAFETAPPGRFRTRIWVRRESGTIGIRRTAVTVRVPGFLFATHRRSAAVLGPDGRLEAQAPVGGSLRYPRLLLETGRWRYRFDLAGEGARVRFSETGGDGTTRAAGPPVGLLEIPPGPARIIDIEVHPGAEPVSVRSLVLARIPE